jgi:hypothetical protein
MVLIPNILFDKFQESELPPSGFIHSKSDKKIAVFTNYDLSSSHGNMARVCRKNILQQRTWTARFPPVRGAHPPPDAVRRALASNVPDICDEASQITREARVLPAFLSILFILSKHLCFICQPCRSLGEGRYSSVAGTAFLRLATCHSPFQLHPPPILPSFSLYPLGTPIVPFASHCQPSQAKQFSCEKCSIFPAFTNAHNNYKLLFQSILHLLETESSAFTNDEKMHQNTVKNMRVLRATPFSLKHRDNFNLADDVVVQFRQFLRRDPKLLLDGIAHGLDRIFQNEIFANMKTRHITGAGIAHIPVARDLDGVVHIEHGIKDGLPGQTRRKGAIAALINQVQLSRPDRAKEGQGVVHVLVQYVRHKKVTLRCLFLIEMTPFTRMFSVQNLTKVKK